MRRLQQLMLNLLRGMRRHTLIVVNALAQLGDLDAALAAYDEGLALAPDWRELQENKELVEALRDQQEKEQQQQGEQTGKW